MLNSRKNNQVAGTVYFFDLTRPFGFENSWREVNYTRMFSENNCLNDIPEHYPCTEPQLVNFQGAQNSPAGQRRYF
jgi:hypothetical protein